MPRLLFSARNAGQLWSVPIKATAHNSAYVLRLEDPFYWYGGELEGVTLALHRAAEESNGRFMDENLLTRGVSRDGTQEFQFEADDLARGMQKMAFGRTRTIRVPESGLVVKITVLNARVTPLALGRFSAGFAGLEDRCLWSQAVVSIPKGARFSYENHR